MKTTVIHSSGKWLLAIIVAAIVAVSFGANLSFVSAEEQGGGEGTVLSEDTDRREYLIRRILELLEILEELKILLEATDIADDISNDTGKHLIDFRIDGSDDTLYTTVGALHEFSWETSYDHRKCHGYGPSNSWFNHAIASPEGSERITVGKRDKDSDRYTLTCKQEDGSVVEDYVNIQFEPADEDDPRMHLYDDDLFPSSGNTYELSSHIAHNIALSFNDYAKVRECSLVGHYDNGDKVTIDDDKFSTVQKYQFFTVLEDDDNLAFLEEVSADCEWYDDHEENMEVTYASEDDTIAPYKVIFDGDVVEDGEITKRKAFENCEEEFEYSRSIGDTEVSCLWDGGTFFHGGE